MTATTATPNAGRIAGELRARRREHGRPLSDRLIDLYSAALGLFVGGTIVASTLDAEVSVQPSLVDTIAPWLPLAFLLAVWVILRFATWQGPVLFTAADLQWLFTSPVSTGPLVVGRLRKAVVLVATVSVVLAGLVGLIADLLVGANGVRVALVAAAALALLAGGSVALSWHVERLASWSHRLDRSGLMLLGVVGLLAAGAALGYVDAVMWSGPWGWAAALIVTAAGAPVAGWPVLAGLLAVAAVAALFAAFRYTDVSEEALWRRAGARSAAGAALFFGDIRGVARAAEHHGEARSERWRRLSVPRIPGRFGPLIRRDVITLLRNPMSVVWAGVLVGLGLLALAGVPDRPWLVIAVFVAWYAASTRLIRPVRTEAEHPMAHRLLPWSWGQMVVVHILVPTVALSLIGWIGVGVLAIAGSMSTIPLGELLVLVPSTAGVLICSAAIAGARRPFPVETMLNGTDASTLLMALWMVTGPMVAVIAFGLAALAVAANPLILMAVWVQLAVVGLILWYLLERPAPE